MGKQEPPSMPEREVCPDCDRVKGIVQEPCPNMPEPYNDGCECELCCAKCWGGMQCANGAVDWRTRALEAEEAMEQVLAGFPDHPRDPVQIEQKRLLRAAIPMEKS